MAIDRSKAKTIIQNAVELTKPRWSQYDQSWSNIDTIFIYHGYEPGRYRLDLVQELVHMVTTIMYTLAINQGGKERKSLAYFQIWLLA